MITTNKINQYLIIILYLCAYDSIGQMTNYMGHIGPEDGLNSQLCTHLAEDNYGNLWIGSFQDVQKYNGYDVSVFPLEKIKGNQSNTLIDLFKDPQGNIWVVQGDFIDDNDVAKKYWELGFQFCNINIINPLSEKIIPFNDYIKSESLDQREIVKIIPRENEIIISTVNGDIYRYTDKLEKYNSIENPSSILSITKDGHVIFFSDNGIYNKYSNGSLTKQFDSTEIEKYEAIVSSPDGRIFLLERIGDDIKVDELVGENTTNLFKISKNFFTNQHLRFAKIQEFKNGSFWIDNNLLTKKDNSKFEKINFQKPVNDYCLSNTGLGYCATNLGVYVLDGKKQLFKKLANNEVTLNSVRAIYVDEHIHAFKTYDGETIRSISDKYDLTFLKDHNYGKLARAHYKDPQIEDCLWSSGSVGIRKIDFKNEKVTLFNTLPFIPIAVNCFIRSSVSSRLYLSSSKGPFILDEQKDILTPVEINAPEENFVETNHIIQRGHEIWFAASEGVLIYNEQTEAKSIQKITANGESFNLQFIHEDRIDTDIVWLGTKKGGIIKWNTLTDSLQVFNTSNGLSNNDVHAIIEDNQERLWVSTNRYLHCLDKRNQQIYVFTEQDGLSHSEFNRYGFFVDSLRQNIYFGGLNGYNYFNPDSINTSSVKNTIDVRIIDVSKTQKDGKSINIFQDCVQSNSLDMNEVDITLQFSLSTNHLFDGEKTQFSYRLPELSENWETQSSNVVKLNRLPYGSYTIEFIADLNKPAFTSNIFTLDINVIQPFTKTMTFYVLVMLGCLSLLWFLVLRYNQNLKERNLKLEEIVSLRTEELREVINTKNKVFAILAHDLRNPISSLSNLTDKIKFLTKYNRLKELNILAEQTNSRIYALNDNLNNILLWALSENNLLKLNPEKLSLLLEIKKILNIYEDQIAEKQLEIATNLIDVDQVYLDVSLLQTILRNLINNAIKFSDKNGKIIFNKGFDDDHRVELKIIDHGIGMSQEENAVLNERNISIKEQGQGSGIGLIISKELISKAGITLNIHSEVNKGTEISLLMPKN